MKKTTWLKIDGFLGIYEANHSGEVRSITRPVKNARGGISIRKGTVLKIRITGKGYVAYALHKDGKRFQLNAARMIAKLFIPNPNNLPEINHKNGIKSDNRASNLEWSNRSLNMIHAWEKGLRKRNHTCSAPRPKKAKK